MSTPPADRFPETHSVHITCTGTPTDRLLAFSKCVSAILATPRPTPQHIFLSNQKISAPCVRDAANFFHEEAKKEGKTWAACAEESLNGKNLDKQIRNHYKGPCYFDAPYIEGFSVEDSVLYIPCRAGLDMKFINCNLDCTWGLLRDGADVKVKIVLKNCNIDKHHWPDDVNVEFVNCKWLATGLPIAPRHKPESLTDEPEPKKRKI